MMKFSRLDRKRQCDICSRQVDVVMAFMNDEKSTLTSRHLNKFGRGFCPGSLDGVREEEV